MLIGIYDSCYLSLIWRWLTLNVFFVCLSGTYPYVTSSNCSIGGVCTGLGLPPRYQNITNRLLRELDLNDFYLALSVWWSRNFRRLWHQLSRFNHLLWEPNVVKQKSSISLPVFVQFSKILLITIISLHIGLLGTGTLFLYLTQNFNCIALLTEGSYVPVGAEFINLATLPVAHTAPRPPCIFEHTFHLFFVHLGCTLRPLGCTLICLVKVHFLVKVKSLEVIVVVVEAKNIKKLPVKDTALELKPEP